MTDDNQFSADSSDFSIPLNTAATWTKAWREKMQNSEWLLNHLVKAFLIPMEDFENIKKQGATNIRAYFGVDESEPDKTKTLKLVLVGVDANGKDMVNTDKGEKAYDFSLPCPTTCDKDSPLNSDLD